jgi:hypothetical protein
LLAYLTRRGFSGFQQADAGGFWRLYATGFESGSNRLYWLFGSFQIDSSGNVVDQSFQVERSNGQQGFFSSGRLLVEQDGRVSGFFEGSGTNASTDFSGQMTTDFNQITLVSAGSQNERLLAVLIYTGDNQNPGFFADTDIDGSWRYFGIRFDPPADDADVSWEFGGLDIENGGTITGDGFTDRGGDSGDISGVRIEVNPQGNLVNGSMQLNAVSRTVNSGQMNIPPFPQTTNPETRFTFVGSDSGGSNGNGGSGVLPGVDSGSGCLIAALSGHRLVDRLLKFIHRR